MLAIQNQKTLWRKKYQCDAKDVKTKTKTANVFCDTLLFLASQSPLVLNC